MARDFHDDSAFLRRVARDCGDPDDALWEIVMLNRGLVYRFARGRANYEDVVQSAFIGLFHAVKTWRPEAGFLLNWSNYYMRNEAARLREEIRGSLRVPRNIVADVRRAEREVQLWAARCGRTPTWRDRVEATGRTAESIAVALRSSDNQMHDRAEAWQAWLNTTPAESVNALDRVIAQEWLKRFDDLTPRQQRVLYRRAQGASLREVGAELDLSREYIRIIEEKAHSVLLSYERESDRLPPTAAKRKEIRTQIAIVQERRAQEAADRAEQAARKAEALEEAARKARVRAERGRETLGRRSIRRAERWARRRAKQRR